MPPIALVRAKVISAFEKEREGWKKGREKEGGMEE
jgi:hypothetical protein